MFGATLLTVGLICHHLRRMVDERPTAPTFLWTILDRIFTIRGVVGGACVAVPLIVWLIGEGLMTRVLHGYVDLHWSRVVLAGLIAYGLGQMIVTTLTVNLLRFHTARRPLVLTQHTATRADALSIPQPTTHRERARAGVSVAPASAAD
jgi:hypothetical protein